jgi:PTH1 family peptidyl-tRNA hydrolase
MNFIIVGLGNPGEEYTLTRHNAGRMAVEYLTGKSGVGTFEEWKIDKKLFALKTCGMIGKNKVTCILPDNYMNNSGKSVKPLIKSKKAAENLVIVHDDLDLPLGKIKISFGKNSGGHKGVESIIKNIKTKDFIRIRIGISGETAKGKLKKPVGQEKVLKVIIGKFKPNELLILKKINKKIAEAIKVIVTENLDKAMNQYNS